MSAPVQGGGGGGSSSSGGDSSPGEAESLAQRRLEMRQAGTPAAFASGPMVNAAQRGLKVRNVLTGLAIGAVVVGIYGYTFYSVSQEDFLQDLELEVKAVQAQAAKTSTD